MNIDKHLLALLKGNTTHLSLSIVSGILMAGCVVLQALILASIINNLFLENQTLQNNLMQLFLFVVLSLGRFTFSWLSGFFAKKMSGTIKTSLRKTFLDKIKANGPVYNSTSESGALGTAYMHGIEVLDNYFSSYVPQLFFSLAIPLLILVFVIPLDLLSGFVLLFTAPIIPVFMVLIGHATQAKSNKQWQALSRMTAYFLDVIQGILTIKILGNAHQQIEKLKYLSAEFNRRTMGVLKVAFLSALVLEMAATLSVAVIAVEIGLRLLYAKIMFHEALFILIIAPEFYNQLRLLGARFHAGMEGVSAANQIFKFLQAENYRVPNKPASVLTAPIQMIKFRNVSFTYPDSKYPALENISFEIPAGSKIALIGKSGSGKSTTVNLLLRFIKPDMGSIEVDGTDLWKIQENDWTRQISWLPQKPYIFHDSILENIRLAKKDATETEVLDSAVKAHLDEFIDALPEQYNTVVGEQGARLSAGQKQRLALARAFLKDAPILILDEPGANLDWQVEKQIRDDLKEWTKNKTVLTIAHNPSAIQNTDQVIQLENGKITNISKLR